MNTNCENESRLDPTDLRVRAVIELMREKVAQRVSVQVLSRTVNLSCNRLRQLFKKETGRTPTRYLKALRMKRAEGLLGNTFLSVKEIVFECGIGDVSGFCREFKKLHGITPSQYRAQNRPIFDGR